MLPYDAFNRFAWKYGSAWNNMLVSCRLRHALVFEKCRNNNQEWQRVKYCVKKLWVAMIINPKIRSCRDQVLEYLIQTGKRWAAMGCKACPRTEEIAADTGIPQETRERILKALKTATDDVYTRARADQEWERIFNVTQRSSSRTRNIQS